MKRWTPLIVLFEASLGIVAVGIGRALGIEPFATLSWEPLAAVVGFLATAPMLAGFVAMWRSEAAFARGLVQRVETMVAALFARASAFELALVAGAAGVGEELLFRGLLQAWTESTLGPEWGLLAAAVIFGLAHPVSRGYVAVATVLGYYLGWLWQVSGNLLAPILAHTLYDFFVLLLLVRDLRWDEPVPARRA